MRKETFINDARCSPIDDQRYAYKCIMNLNGFQVMFYIEYDGNDPQAFDYIKSERDKAYRKLSIKVAKMNKRYLRKKNIVVNINPGLLL